jgi:hypothetical protein
MMHMKLDCNTRTIKVNCNVDNNDVVYMMILELGFYMVPLLLSTVAIL